MNRGACRFLLPSLRRSIFTTTFLLSNLQRSSIIHTVALSQSIPGSSSSSSSSGSSSNNPMSSKKTAQELQIQWAGGRDVWPKVPISSSATSIASTSTGGDVQRDQFVSIQTRVKDNHAPPTKTTSTSTSTMDWPDIVKQSILFGFGAYNPRGQTLAEEINEAQHTLLRDDLQQSISHPVVYWEAAAIWEDGSSERGFIVAVPKTNDSDNGNGMTHQQCQELCINLAKKYDQGAIYRYEMEERTINDDGNGNNGHTLALMRDTVAVLDKGTDARVEVEIDTDADLSSFMETMR